MSRRHYLRDWFRFFLIAVVLLLGMRGLVSLAPPEQDPAALRTQQLWKEMKLEQERDAVDVAALEPAAGIEEPQTLEPELFEMSVPSPSFTPAPESWFTGIFDPHDTEEVPVVVAPEPQDPQLQKTVKTHYKGPPKIVIIIDDLGLNQKRTADVTALPGPLTLAFLPYAENVGAQVSEAQKAGHQIIIHTPMEPVNARIDPGPIALKAGMSAEDLRAVLENEVLTAFEGYAGINNHMGSKLTQDPEAMGVVMQVLKERGLFFVDSKTIHNSVAARTAQLYEVDYAERDVFLDHFEDSKSVYSALKQLEAAARRNSYAIGIGHPKPATIEALQAWLPTLQEKGFELVPVGSILEKPWDKAGDKIVNVNASVDGIVN